MTTKDNAVVAIYKSHMEAEAAVKELHSSPEETVRAQDVIKRTNPEMSEGHQPSLTKPLPKLATA